MVLAALRLADCLLTAESSLLDPHPFLPMLLLALQLPLAGQSKDRDSSLTGLIGPLCLLGLATPQLTASKPYPWLPLACSLPLLLPAFWLLDYLLAAETFVGYATLFATGRTASPPTTCASSAVA